MHETLESGAQRTHRPTDVSEWPVRRKVALVLAVPLLLAAVLGGLRVQSALADSSAASATASQVTVLGPSVAYLSAAEDAAMVFRETDDQEQRDAALRLVNDAAADLEAAWAAADLSETERAQVRRLLTSTQGLRDGSSYALVSTAVRRPREARGRRHARYRRHDRDRLADRVADPPRRPAEPGPARRHAAAAAGAAEARADPQERALRPPRCRVRRDRQPGAAAAGQRGRRPAAPVQRQQRRAPRHRHAGPQGLGPASAIRQPDHPAAHPDRGAAGRRRVGVPARGDPGGGPDRSRPAARDRARPRGVAVPRGPDPEGARRRALGRPGAAARDRPPDPCRTGPG